MQQVVIIHGGDSFKTEKDYYNFLKNREISKENFQSKHGWKTTIEKSLGTGFEVLQPQMPNAQNARYNEWKIWFERSFQFLSDEVILAGHSLGGMFLVKYLAQSNFPSRIKQLHLVAPPHNQTLDVADFMLPQSLKNVSAQTENIYIYFSKDDPLVHFTELETYKKDLPRAKVLIFEDRGHFRQDNFKELINIIKT